MKQYFMYMVRGADGSLYTGFTTDVHRRVAEHNGLSKTSGAKATRMKRPVELAYFECFASKHDAMSREWHVKKLTKAQKEKLIKDNKMMKVILASGSPRRRELLSQAGIDYEVCPADIEEVTTKTAPAEVVEELSRNKAMAVAGEHKGEIVLAADTVVAFDGKILGKPKDEDAALEMLTMLSGQVHEVYTGVTIVGADGKATTFSECTKVEMYENTKDELFAYIETKEPMDKAGAYGIQGRGAVLVKSISGDYNNVVGLPLSRVVRTLKQL